MAEDRPSRTAYKVALSIIALGAKQGMEEILPPGIVDATKRLLIASGAVEERFVRWAGTQIMVSVYEAFDWMLPGQFEAFGYRKAFFEHQVRDGIAKGATQILVLGAGYDTLGWRLAPEFPEVSFFEIDLPATTRLKSKGIDVIGSRDNLFLLAEDLCKRRLVDVLLSSEAWRANAQTVIVAEGLVMYLRPEAVQDLFCQCNLVTAEGSWVIFSYIPSGPDGRLDAGEWTGFMLWLQKIAGEPWLWSIRPERLRRFLRECGWGEFPGLQDITRKYGVEFCCVAAK